jgi:myosin heavy subunit
MTRDSFQYSFPAYLLSHPLLTAQILEEVGIASGEYAWGRSKVFVRNPRALFDLEDKRRRATIVLVTKIQVH